MASNENESHDEAATSSENVPLMPNSDDSLICEAYDRAMSTSRSTIPANLMHLVQNTAEEIKRNHLQAKIRLKNNSQGGNAMVDLISDQFYAVHEWPNYAIEIILSPDFKYPKRLGLAAFFVGNGLIDAPLAEQMFKFYNKHWNQTQLWNQRFREFRDLFKYLNKPHDDPDSVRIRSQYFYYSMEAKQTLYFNGEIRHLSRQQ